VKGGAIVLSLDPRGETFAAGLQEDAPRVQDVEQGRLPELEGALERPSGLLGKATVEKV